MRPSKTRSLACGATYALHWHHFANGVSCTPAVVLTTSTPPPPPPARALSLYLSHSKTHTHTATRRAYPTSDGQTGDPTPRLLPPMLRAIARVTPAMDTCSLWKPMQTTAGGNVDSRVWHAGMLTIPAAGTPEGLAFRPSLRGQPFRRSFPAIACFIQRCCLYLKIRAC